MKIKLPCEICIVNPMCITVCEELLDLYVAELNNVGIYINNTKEFCKRIEDTAKHKLDRWFNYSNSGKYVRSANRRLNLCNIGMFSVHIKYGRMTEIYTPEEVELPF